MILSTLENKIITGGKAWGVIKYDKDYNKLGIKRRQWVRMTNAIDEVRETTRLIKEGKEKVLIQREREYETNKTDKRQKGIYLME